MRLTPRIQKTFREVAIKRVSVGAPALASRGVALLRHGIGGIPTKSRRRGGGSCPLPFRLKTLSVPLCIPPSLGRAERVSQGLGRDRPEAMIAAFPITNAAPPRDTR